MKIGLRCRCAALALGLLALAGCVAPKPPSDERPLQPVPNVPDRPEVVTDLSKLSAADTTAVALPPVLPTVSPLQSTSNVSVGASRNEQLTHKLAAGEPGRYDTETPSSDTQAPGGTRLLNDKARQYANFSDILLTQTMRAALTLEPEKLGSKRVPLELTPVVLTAIMDPEGRLKEIVIEHHSGDLAVDRLFIEACKQGIWSRNPPVGARSVEGTYRVQIQGSVSNRTFDRYGQYTYSTEIGLAIL
ncbi:MAG TPA: hypothetical protein VKS22_11400 [Candidatus Binataceae bacterium]|nr:hypothetical protein [Candidatus Binataceae bacterium]